jgi:hypothetical protein
MSSKVRSGWCNGHAGARVTVRTNDAANPRVKLVACATVKHAIKTQPLPDRFGKFTFERFSRASAQQTMTIRLIRGDGGPLQPEIRGVGLLGWDASEGKSRLQPSPNLSAVVCELDPGERYDLTVTARPPWPAWGIHLSVIVATGVPAQPEYKVRFYLDVEPRLRAEPDHFLPQEARSPAGWNVRMRWSDDEPP